MVLTAGNRCVWRKHVFEVLICPPQILQECLRIERGPPWWKAEDFLQNLNAVNPADYYYYYYYYYYYHYHLLYAGYLYLYS